MTVKICANKVYKAVGDFVPNQPNTKKLITKSVNAILKYGPL